MKSFVQTSPNVLLRRKLARAGFDRSLLPSTATNLGSVRESPPTINTFTVPGIPGNGTQASIGRLFPVGDIQGRRRSGLITVILADDHQVMRQGLKSLFEKETDFQVIGEASDRNQTIQIVERLQPQVLVLDLMMDGINGLEVTRQLCQRIPQTNIVILSNQSNEAYVAEALRAGAKAYVLKESSFEELVQAIRKAAYGQHFLSAALSERMIESYLHKRNMPTDPYETLTTREREVLLLASHGQSNAKIAERLVISRRTVEVHRAKMMHKLNLSNQIELVRFALQRGILG